MKKDRLSLIKYVCLLLTLVNILFSCSPRAKETKVAEVKVEDSLNFNCHTTLKYAKGFSVEEHKNYKVIRVTHPITGDVMATYVTRLAGKILPDSVKALGQVVQVPANSIACLSTTQITALDLIGVPEKLIGCSNPNNIWNTYYQSRVEAGHIQEIGRGMNFNLEKVVQLAPELLMQNFMDKTDVDGNLAGLGTIVLYNNEFKESSLLGRAEWLKFAALFFCREAKADSVFNEIERNYLAVKAIAQQAKDKPKVMYGYDYRGTWYLPQSGTYVAQTLRDAGAEFQTAGEGNSSIPKSFEEIYALFNDCDIWLTTQGKVKTYKDFVASNERYLDFRSAQQKQVYSNNKREKPAGGNDYWESGTCRPDLLLKDIVKILHPDLLPDYETTYWQHLE